MYVTCRNIDTLTPQQLLQEFLEAIKELVDMDASDYADRFDIHPEWVANECWKRMREEDKTMLKESVADIEESMSWSTMSDTFQKEFYTFYTGYYN